MIDGSRLLLPVAAALLFLGCVSDPAWEMRMLNLESRHADAVALFERGFVLEEAGVPTLFELCRAYFETKRYDAFHRCADRFMKQIRLEREQAPVEYYPDPEAIQPHQQVASMQTWRAFIKLESGDYPGALREAERAIETLRRQGDPDSPEWSRRMTQAYRAAGLSHALMGRLETARALRDRLSGLIPIDSSAALRAALHNAEVQLGLAVGDYRQAAEAIADYDRVHPIQLLMLAATWVNPVQGALNTLSQVGQEALMDRQAMMVTLPRRFMLGHACLESGQWDCAREELTAVLEDPRFHYLADLHWLALHDQGRLARQAGEPEGAIDWWRQAVAAIEAQRPFADPGLSRTGLVGDRARVYRDLVGALFDAGAVEEAFVYAERRRALALARLLARPPHFLGGARVDEETRALASRVEEGAVEARFLDARRTPEQWEALAERRRADFERLSERDPETAALMGVREPSVERIQGLLGEKEILAAYYRAADNGWLLFVLSREAFHGLRLPADDVAPLALAFRRAAADPRSDAHHLLGRRLYERLIVPAAQWIPAGAALTIVASDALSHLPFAALSPDGVRHLIDDHLIRILPTAGSLVHLPGDPVGEPGRLLAIGDPLREGGESLAGLASAREESLAAAIAVARIDNRLEAKVLLGDQATEGALRREGYGPRYLHLAVPAALSDAQPMASALLLAPDDDHDGRLSVRELYDLRLSADLVTLTACQVDPPAAAAAGENGEGLALAAMIRGFFHAGARGLVTGLWRLEADGSAQFSRRFHQHLKAGLSKPAAVRAAQIDTRGSGLAHPHFWAGFLFAGAP